MKQVIATEKAPAAIGPYSQAIRAGDFVFASGQLPLDPASGKFPAEDIAGQTEQSLKNLKAVLEAAGGGLKDVVKTSVFLAKIEDFAAMNDVYKTFFTSDCPARSAFQVGNLPRAALIEIEAIAYIPK
jgi:2-iminobutanoate/2-iminopropanoate deaminase